MLFSINKSHIFDYISLATSIIIKVYELNARKFINLIILILILIKYYHICANDDASPCKQKEIDFLIESLIYEQSKPKLINIQQSDSLVFDEEKIKLPNVKDPNNKTVVEYEYKYYYDYESSNVKDSNDPPDCPIVVKITEYEYKSESSSNSESDKLISFDSDRPI